MRPLNFISLVLLSFCLAACDSRQMRLSVTNHSAATLTNVVAAGESFSVPIGSLAPGAHREIAIASRGEAIVTLNFDAAGKHFSPGKDLPQRADAHFKEAYNADVIVTPDFGVSEDVKLR